MTVSSKKVSLERNDYLKSVIFVFCINIIFPYGTGYWEWRKGKMLFFTSLFVSNLLSKIENSRGWDQLREKHWNIDITVYKILRGASGNMPYDAGSSSWCPATTSRAGCGGGRREVQEGGTRYLRLVHIAVWPKPAQHCQTNSLQLKIKKQTNKKHPENRHADGRLPTYLWGHRCLSGGHGISLAPPAERRWDPLLRRQWKRASGSPEIHPRKQHIQGESCCCQDSLNEHGDTGEN